MNGKKARELRKATGFIPSVERTYNVAEIEKMGYIQQFDSVNKKINLVERPVIKNIVECSQYERILYKYYKSRYNNPNKAELVLNQLPTTEALDDISKQIRYEEDIQRSKEGISTITGGGLSSEIDPSGRVKIEERRSDVESTVSGREG